ncbi:MAG: Nif3-like dinuclear metal center hexameric protein [Thermodesulfobacteriota bacterium]
MRTPFLRPMAALLKDILARLDAAYPFAWAVPEDRVGLQVGHPENPVEVILAALEVSEPVVAEAQAKKAQLLLTHHPLLYQPLGEVREDRGAGRLLAAVLRAGLALVACHTNLDVAPAGVNDYLARLLKLEEVELLSPVSGDPLHKLAVFVPVGYEDRVREALFDDRVGVIGRYSHCSFAGRGQGTYLPLQGAQPFRGEVASLTRAEESRLEVLVPESRVLAALDRLKASHPYEEVAYDLYPLKNSGSPLGFGRLGRLSPPLDFTRVVAWVKEVFGVSGVRVWGPAPARVERVAVLGGSGGDFISTAREKGAQLYITGEVRHHQVNLGDLKDFAILEVGHFSSEAVFIPEWVRQLNLLFQENGLKVQVHGAQTEAPPFACL